MNLAWLDALPPFDKWELSPEAREGLGAARALQRLRGNEFGPAIRELADSYGCHPRTIRRWIAKAHRELTAEQRPCADCDRLLPRASRSSRIYCDDHGAGAARVARYRAGPSADQPRGRTRKSKNPGRRTR